ncbi:MAG: GYD domain-containing protein [Methanobacteriota archaeon]|nr:MAG: GYD domain-containing protein [Euryarchaeota archaeon]
MPHYFVLGNWTDQGVRNVRESPKRIDAAKDLASKLGGRFEVYLTMGQYDFVGVGEMPNDEAVMQFALQIGSQGNARTTTLKAWTQGEATKVIAKLQ